MIPKQLFFIWLGNEPPNYCNFAINAFKEVNPDFKVELIMYNNQEISDLKNINNIEELKDIKTKLLFNSIRKTLNDEKTIGLYSNFLVCLSDCYRELILNEYGGIYLDCDTFPLKPFDDKLLYLKNFRISNCYNGITLYSDNYFIGKEKYTSCKPEILVPEFLNKYKHTERKKLFLDLKLKYDLNEYDNVVLNHKNIYIEHFQDGKWRNETYKLKR